MSTTYRIRWSEAALQDVESILHYIAHNDDVGSALRVHELLLERIEGLARYPERGRVVPELAEIGIVDFRELLVKPYRICFRIHGRDLVLVAVLDGRRDLEQLLLDRALNR